MEFSMKLSWFFNITALSITTVLAGCASSGSNQENQLLNNDLSTSATQALATQSLCCNDLAQVTYPALETGKKLINGTSPAMQFESGKSYFYAAKIDDQYLGKQLSIHSSIGKTVFPLQVLLLKADHQVSRSLPLSAFSTTGYSLMSSPALKADIQLFPEEKFMIIYADNRMMGKSIKIPHPEKLKEKATGIVAPPYPDLDIPFSPWGVVEIQTAGNNSALSKLLSSEPVLSSQNTTTGSAPAATAVAPKSSTSTVAVTASSQTQQYYQQAIQQAVKNNQIEQAMQLVAEAEKLGFNDARTVFVEAVKQK
jgi:Maltose operon periplasmic protein precursor (MalM).